MCIYTTAFPLHTLVSLHCTYKQLPNFDKQRRNLERVIRYFGEQTNSSPLPLRNTQTPIQSIPVADASEVVALSERIQAAGIDVRAIRYPTVRRGAECLRVCMHAFNTEAEIDQLMIALANQRHELFIA